jgi:hypothetical protein
MGGKWTGGSVNRTWHQGRQRDGTETEQVRAVLGKFRRDHGWQPGMTWNPYLGAYEYPASYGHRES